MSSEESILRLKSVRPTRSGSDSLVKHPPNNHSKRKFRPLRITGTDRDHGIRASGIHAARQENRTARHALKIYGDDNTAVLTKRPQKQLPLLWSADLNAAVLVYVVMIRVMHCTRTNDP